MTALDFLVPASELYDRIRRFQRQLRSNGSDGALIVQNADLYYFSGTIQQAHLYIPAEGEPLLMARKSLPRAREESALERVEPIKSPRQLPDLLAASGIAMPHALGLEMDVLPVNQYRVYADLFPDARLIDVSDDIRRVRAVKSTYEIDQIRFAARMADEVAATMATHLREGMMEVELAGLIEGEARKRGHQGVVRMRMWGGELFYGHLLAGPRGAVPSYLASPTGGAGLTPAVAQGAGFSPIRAREPILLDYVFAWNGYIADHTRIFAIGGVPEDLLKAHEAMLTVQETVKRAIHPGAIAGDLYSLAVDAAKAMGVDQWFMGSDDSRVHFIGHGIGLELDEYPFLAKGQETVLASGMVIALEPKLIIPGKGVVGIENTLLVTESGVEQLTGFDEGICIL
ncbi:MAG: Xaa-Pro peptidase family protein [Desulfobacterales bacterium]|jgi:Xaa-Pro aminopeptidase